MRRTPEEMRQKADEVRAGAAQRPQDVEADQWEQTADLLEALERVGARLSDVARNLKPRK